MSFATLADAEIAAYAGVRARAYVNAYAVQLSDTPFIRAQLFMSAAQPDAGAWVNLFDVGGAVITPGNGTVTLHWSPLSFVGTIYTGYRVALTGTVSPQEFYMPAGTEIAVFPTNPPDDYSAVVQRSVADLSEVDTATVLGGDVTVDSQHNYLLTLVEI